MEQAKQADQAQRIERKPSAVEGCDDEGLAGASEAAGCRARLWLVDGYNVLNTSVFRNDSDVPGDGPGERDGAPAQSQSRSRWWSESMRERLVALTRCFPHPDAEIWIVFDGPRPSQETRRGEHPSVHVDFAASADDWIVKRVRGAPDPTRVAVVTRDRRVAGRVAHRGAQVVWPLEFLRRCGHPKADV